MLIKDTLAILGSLLMRFLSPVPTGSCHRWHHQEAYLLRASDDEAVQGGARGRSQGEAQDGLRPGHV